MSAIPPDDHEFSTSGLAGLYALNALEGDDLARFEARLEVDVELQQEVAEFRATAGRLSEIVAATPPPGLRERVLADVANTRQDAPIVRLADRRAATVRRRVLAVAAAVLVLAVGAVGGFLVGGDDSEPASQLAALMGRGDTKVIPLRGVGDGATAGHVVVSASTGQVVVVSNGMPVPADGRTYELWMLDGQRAHKAGLFEPDAKGRVEAALAMDLDGATGFAITDEPDGGSPQATTPILMQATLA